MPFGYMYGGERVETAVGTRDDDEDVAFDEEDLAKLLLGEDESGSEEEAGGEEQALAQDPAVEFGGWDEDEDEDEDEEGDYDPGEDDGEEDCDADEDGKDGVRRADEDDFEGDGDQVLEFDDTNAGGAPRDDGDGVSAAKGALPGIETPKSQHAAEPLHSSMEFPGGLEHDGALQEVPASTL